LTEVPEIEDSLIVNLYLPGGGFFMPLFVKLKDGLQVDEALHEKVRARMRKAYSARHVPDKIYQVKAIPYTLTGKKMEVPVRRILMGVPVEKAANRAAMSNVESLDYFIDYARTQQDYRLSMPQLPTSACAATAISRGTIPRVSTMPCTSQLGNAPALQFSRPTADASKGELPRSRA